MDFEKVTSLAEGLGLELIPVIAPDIFLLIRKRGDSKKLKSVAGRHFLLTLPSAEVVAKNLYAAMGFTK